MTEQEIAGLGPAFAGYLVHLQDGPALAPQSGRGRVTAEGVPAR